LDWFHHICAILCKNKNCTIITHTGEILSINTSIRVFIKEKKYFNTHTFERNNNSIKTIFMSGKATISFLTLPVEIIYRILDNLNELSLLISARDVCTRLNTIIDSYHPYKVNLFSIFK
jgi:hypothetical protein